MALQRAAITNGNELVAQVFQPDENGNTGFPTCAEQPDLFITHRNLPHWQLQGSIYFVTFRLKSGELTATERNLVLEALQHFQGDRQQVSAAVIMPDHVHLLLRPLPTVDGACRFLGDLLKSTKGFSAREINKLRRRKGTVWQEESFDRIVRDEQEFLEKWRYIRNNPVKTGLVSRPEEYPWLWEAGR